MLKKRPLLAFGRGPSFRIRATVDPDFLEWGLRFLRNCTSARFSRNTRAGLALALESRLAMHALLARPKFDFVPEVSGKMNHFIRGPAFAVPRPVLALHPGPGAVPTPLRPQTTWPTPPAAAGPS